MNYFNIAVNTPFNKSILTYMSEEEWIPGELVVIPLGKREVIGCILNRIEENEELLKLKGQQKLKIILSKYDENFNLSQAELTFYQWMAKYYHYPLGQLIFNSLPKKMKRPKELKYIQGKAKELPFERTKLQDEIFHRLKEEIRPGKFDHHLIHGVTGSGKSVIYLSLIKEVLDRGESVLFLLPEINLTPQFVDFFENYLSVKIYSYHSSISGSDKYGLWKKLKKNDEAVFIIGVRSSIFLPIENLGMIIVDEEHDQSFKQDDRCPYNARDMAIKKASLQNCFVLLGSATPSLESFYKYKKANKKHDLFVRPNKIDLPVIEFVDMRKKSDRDEIWPFEQKVIDEIQEAINRKEQVLVFINKLGHAQYMQCRSCGHRFECPNCHTHLRLFKERSKLECHICEYKSEAPLSCPACGNMKLLNKGFGTEKIAEVLSNHLKGKVIKRLDRDEIKTFNRLEERLSEFHSGVIDVLVGTQMISKGHNFKNVKLVVVLGVDSQLNFPDFRSNERVYQLLEQVCGRAGRYENGGRVLIQTLAPENQVFKYIKEHSFEGFYQDELEMRSLCHCPPFNKIATLSFNAKNQKRLVDFSVSFKTQVDSLIKKHFPKVEIHGPRPAFIEKRVNRYTWIALIKSDDTTQLHNFINTVTNNVIKKSEIQIKIDIDPLFIE